MNTVVLSVLVLGGIGAGFALLLAFLSKKLHVEEDPRMMAILEILPGLNCGACGYSGCRAYAEAVVRECNVFGGCLPAGAELNKKISDMLGVVGCISKDKRVVVCHCWAGQDQKKVSSQYDGPLTCKAAHLIGGAIDCAYGCMAFGDCVKVCPVDALRIENQNIVVDFKKCIGCAKCVAVCPRKLFELVPLKADIYYVACRNKEKALTVKKVCSAGCIGCSLCTRVKDAPYYMKDNLSYIDPKKVAGKDGLEEGKNKCPTKCILKESIPPAVFIRR